MPLYFAYGSCMNRNSLAQTVGRFSVIGPARLNGYRLRFDRRGRPCSGAADIARSSRSHVQGILYAVRDFKALDRREGAPKTYRRIQVTVRILRHAKPYRAWSYTVVNKSKHETPPSTSYARLVWNSSKPLSPAYRNQLKKKLHI
ncbi:MAG: gamma-glutamylcyclotransferase family protein [Tumebacillaceae bacterium]